MAKQTDYTTDIVALFRDLYPLDTGKPIIPGWLGGLLTSFFPLPEGHPAARNVLYGTSKKQGKSTIGGVVALYMASRKRYSEVVIAAADQDQSRDRVFKSVKYAVEHHPVWKQAKVYRDVIELGQGSTITAIPSDWKGAAGGNFDCIIFDELHTYTLENQRRLFDELVIPPTKPEGVRWIASYAGWLGESMLLYEIWQQALKGQRLEGELPVFSVPEASLMALIDTGEASWRMPWSTPEYMRQVEQSERPNTYRRLWLNEWVSNESEFVPMEAWEACKSGDVRPLQPKDTRRVVLGADASTSRDCTALVGVRAEVGEAAEVLFVRVWKPGKSLFRAKPTVDLDETIKAEILDLHRRRLVDAVYYDPYQLHSIALDLSKQGVNMIELPQTNQRTAADQALYDAIMTHTLKHYGDATLTEHVRNAVAVETPRGFRLAKEKTTRKIDAAVALSMAHYGAIETRGQNEASMIFDPFSDWPPPEDHYYTPDRGWVKQNKYHEHSAGATSWQDCTRRTKGCDACEAELMASGYFEERTKAEAELGPPMSEEQYNQERAEMYRAAHWQPPPSQEELLAGEIWRGIKRKVQRGERNNV